jgi:iron complex transport system permease protein
MTPGAETIRTTRGYTGLYGVLVALLAGLALASLLLGDVTIAPADLLASLAGDDSSIHRTILLEIRVPRTLLAILVGASLGLAGAALQGMLYNPLADPGVIGVAGSAALGAVVALYFGWTSVFALALPLTALASGLLSVVLIFALAGWNRSSLSLILAGVSINAFATALTAVALNLAPSPYAALEIVFWLLGSLSDRSFEHVWIALPLMLAGAILILSASRALDALSLGEHTAQSLGFNLPLVRFRVILGVAATVGAAVAVAGSIGFVGLVVPHILRRFVDYRPGALLAVSALGGAVLLLLADITVRLVPVHPELKLGVVTALIGAPFFLSLVLRPWQGVNR